MRIGIDARILTLTESRGMASYLLELLRRWPDPQDELILFSEEQPIPERVISPAQIQWKQVISPQGSRFHIWDWWALPKAVRQTKLNLFWSPANRSFPFYYPPQIVTIHDTLLQEQVSYQDKFEQSYFCRITPALTRRFAHKVITVSHFSAKRISQVFKYPFLNICVIFNGASMPSGRFKNRQEAQRYLATEGVINGKFFYALGAESKWKNTAGLLNAFKLIQSEFPEISLVISGIQERARISFEEICRNLGLHNEKVKLLGFVSRKIRDALYQGAEIFIYPSLFEGFGLPPLEAMAMKTPVVASHAASIPEVVNNAALQVNAQSPHALANTVMQLLINKKLREQKIKLGLENIKRFNWNDSAFAHHKVMVTAVAE